MVNHPHNNLFNRGDTERQIKIAFSGGTITNKEMHQGSFNLTESLCSEESLRFGTCESSVLQFKVHNVLTPLVGEKLTVYELLNGNTAEPFDYGKYKVQSDKPTADRKYRDVVAYDAMYDILNADVASWYNGLTFPCTIGYFRKQFLKHLGIEYVDTELINDGIYIQKTIDVEELSGKTVINAICEINGCFGHINRQGKFQYITLKQHEDGLYPSETLYPKDPVNEETFYNGNYNSCKYEDFETQEITGIRIRQEEDDIGCTVGTTENAYVVQDNFLVYGMDHEELTTVANNLFSVISNIYYRPIEYVKTSGKPYLEVGDNISVGSSEVIIETYILERTITGVKGQKDEFSSRGTEYYPKEINGLNRQITKIKGMYNRLTRTVDETRLEMGDMEKELYSTISVTAKDLRSEFTNTANGLQSQITQTASQIRTEVSDLEDNLQSQITQTVDSISLEVKRAQDAESSLSIKADEISANVTTISTNLENNYYTIAETDTKISASSEGILLSVSKTYKTQSSANSDYNSLSSRISLNAESISLKVSKGSVISEINQTVETVKISASKIDLTGYVTISDLSGNGTTSINGANIQTGTIRADSISDLGVLTVSNITCGSSFQCTNYSGTAQASFDMVSASSIFSNYVNFNFYNNKLVGLCSFSFVDANGTTHDVSFIGTHSESVG